MNKILFSADPDINYVFHMLSVANSMDAASNHSEHLITRIINNNAQRCAVFFCP